ncbi:TRAP transporter large permease [Microvirga zambiensis]|uniref:TRAP transporter large permease n=1 Tax=Microvirga zambiensis TaxID=1402137 RepID=UPI00191CE8C7|nr:TRAP transporter large permease subunit [Microvirga zambiensis]
MDWLYTFIALIGSVIALGAIGVPVAFAFLLVNFGAAFLLMGGLAGVQQVVSNASSSISIFSLVPVPMFMLMGELFFRTGLAPRVFDALDKLLGRIPGRLSFLTVGGGTLFAALSGSSLANTAMMGSLLVPNMVARQYKPKMIMGPIMGAGALAVLIPPSGLTVLYGSLSNIDIGSLLIAGVGPGLLMAVLYCVVIILQMWFDPEAAPAYAEAREPLASRLWFAAQNVLPMGVVIFAVIGLILLGVATPTEASAFGALSVIGLAAVYRRLTINVVVKSLMGAMRSTSMLLLILLSSTTFAQVMAFSGASSQMVSFAMSFDLAPFTILIMMLLVLLILGMFMDQISMMMLTLPIYLPIANTLGFDMIWFGMMQLIVIELGMLTPPFGLLLFVMMGSAPAGTTFGSVVKSVVPYVVVQIIVVALIMFIPPIATGLPSLMR